MIQLAATRSSLSNHPEVNHPAEPANLRSCKRSISSVECATGEFFKPEDRHVSRRPGTGELVNQTRIGSTSRRYKWSKGEL